MRQELTAPWLSALQSGEGIPDRIAVQLGEQLVDSRLGPILSLSSPEPVAGESGRYHRYVTRLQRTAIISDTGYPEIETYSGAGADEQTAKLRAIGEAIERYCLSLARYDECLKGRATELDRPVLDPERMLAFSDAQRANKPFDRTDVRDAVYHWTATTRLTDGEKMFVPNQLVRLPFSDDLTVRQPVSHGAAAGTDVTSALYRALCELVERECFAIAYLNELPAPQIDLMSLPAERCQELATELTHMGWQLTAIDLSLDHPFETCLVIGISDGDETPLLNLGLNAADGILPAIEGALREVFQFAVQQPADPTPELLEDPEANVRTLDDRKAFWDRQGMADKLDFWLKSTATRDVAPAEACRTPDLVASIDRFRAFLQKQNLEAYVSDATTTDIRNRGFRVVSVSIPEFHPLHLDEKFRYLGTERLYEVPVRTGYFECSQAEDDLNNIPHPFL
jgi:ribosomal protein S12 methylthiotransferase accessory factor